VPHWKYIWIGEHRIPIDKINGSIILMDNIIGLIIPIDNIIGSIIPTDRIIGLIRKSKKIQTIALYYQGLSRDSSEVLQKSVHYYS